MFCSQATTGNQGRRACFVFQDEALRVFTSLNIFQALAHRIFGVFSHNAWARHVFAVFCIVRNRVIHVSDTAFIDQINDQLQFMQAFKVRHFRCITSFDQRFETSLNQFNRTTAQHSLFTEQVCFCLFAEVGFDDTGTAATIRHCIRQSDVAGRAGFILIDSDQVRHAATLSISTAYGVAWCFRSDHDDVQISAWHNLSVVNVEAMCKRKYRALLGVRCNVFVVHLSDIFIRQQNHDDVSSFHCFIDFCHFQASAFGFRP